MSGLLGKDRKSTTTLDPMLTEEQKKAQAALSQLGTTGSYGGINLGEAYDGSLGNFDMTGIEGMAGNKLMDLLNSGALNTAKNTLTGMANTQFNPDDPSSGFAAYQRQVQRASQGATDALNRDAAITGDRFSSRLGQQKVDLAAQQSDMLGTKLADLYNTAQNRSLTAASGLMDLENTNMNIANAAFQNGGLERLLKSAEAQAKYSEFQRQRSEKLGQIDALNGVFGRGVSFGEMSKTTTAPSVFSQMLGSMNPLVGSYNTAKYGANNAPGQTSFADLVKLATSMYSPGKSTGSSL